MDCGWQLAALDNVCRGSFTFFANFLLHSTIFVGKLVRLDLAVLQAMVQEVQRYVLVAHGWVTGKT